MTTSPNPKPSDHPPGDARTDAQVTPEKLADVMQQGLSAMMVLPQRMMQANLAAINEGMNFMNRRMKAQAAIWSGLGNARNGAGLAEAQQQLMQAMTQEMAEGAREFGDMARRNIGMVTQAVTPPGDDPWSGKSS